MIHLKKRRVIKSHRDLKLKYQNSVDETLDIKEFKRNFLLLDKHIGDRTLAKLIEKFKKHNCEKTQCIKCVYRELESGMCYYTMLTDRSIYIKDGICDCFIDIRDKDLREALIKAHNKN